MVCGCRQDGTCCWQDGWGQDIVMGQDDESIGVYILLHLQIIAKLMMEIMIMITITMIVMTMIFIIVIVIVLVMMMVILMMIMFTLMMYC